MPPNIENRTTGAALLYALWNLSRNLTTGSHGSMTRMRPLQAGHRSFFLDREADISVSETQRSMQASCASSVQGQALTQVASGVSVELRRQMKQTCMLGSEMDGCRFGVGGAAVRFLAGWAPSAGLGGWDSSIAESVLLSAWSSPELGGFSMAGSPCWLAIVTGRGLVCRERSATRARDGGRVYGQRAR